MTRKCHYTRQITALVIAAVLMLSGCQYPGGADAAGPPGSDSKQVTEWFYESFDEEHRAAYDAFRKAAMEPFASDPVLLTDAGGNGTNLPVSELSTVYQGFLYDHPEVFWLSGSYNYRVSESSGEEEFADAVSVIPIPGSEAELNRQITEFESAAQEILGKADQTADDREKAVIFYDCLTENTEYVEEALYDSTLLNEHTAYGAIAGKAAVCDGIALAYKYLLDSSGIECIVIPGAIEGTPHVWNTVFWDESWHEADPTWDIASGENDKRQYFDLTTVEMNKDHVREESGIALMIPVAD